MSDTIFKYYDVNLTNEIAAELGYESKNICNKFDYTTSKKGRICVMINRPPKEHTGVNEYKVSFSFCSPEDNFSKRVARRIASGRSTITISSEEKMTVNQVGELAINMLHDATKNRMKAKYKSTYDKVTISVPNWFSVSDRMYISSKNS